MKCKCKWTVKRDGKIYNEGDVIDISAEDAEMSDCFTPVKTIEEPKKKPSK